MNDPDTTMSFPVVEVSGELNGTPSRSAFPLSETIMSNPTVGADADPGRFEPTVFSAARRYRVIVVALAILAMVAAAGYSLHQPKIYQAEADVTVPLPASSQTDPGQYLDSQVLLLESQGVAQQAANIANSELGPNRLNTSDFYGSDASLRVLPPATASPGSYGASIVTVAFKGLSPEIAQVGLSAVLQAFDQAVAAGIKAQANATLAGINQAISQSSNTSQQAALLTQETQTIVNEQTDLARTPTAAFGPTTRANDKWAVDGAIGLVAGLIAGVGLVYALAVRRRRISGRQDASLIYGVPMIAETPAFRVRGGDLPVAADPYSPVAEAFRFAASSVERICTARAVPQSLAFVSPLAGAGKSTVIANLALAMAEGGTRLLVVDADVANGGLTARLLPGIPISGGFEQVVRGQLALADCIHASPLNDAIAVLGSGAAASRPVMGAARSRAARALLARAKASFDIVLMDTPGLLEVAGTTELVDAADSVIIVVNPNERLPDHLEMRDRLKPNGSDVVGYLYNRAETRLRVSRYQGYEPMARPVPEARANLNGARISDDKSSRPQPKR